MDTVATPVLRIEGDRVRAAEQDWLAAEEPLEIRLGYDKGGWRVHKSVSITMRTPGADRELAMGFLFTEGIVAADEVAHVRVFSENVVGVELRDGVAVDLARLERHFYTSSSCGVCGKTSIAALGLGVAREPLADGPVIALGVVHGLAGALRARQAVFERTGGLHAAALFDPEGNLRAVQEDVGRHNAVDKLIGSQLLEGNAGIFPQSILFVSGRASFELVQKAAAARLPIMAAVGAPSSLAVDLAREHGLTLLGFVRGNRCNLYCGAQRIREGAEIGAPVPETESDSVFA